MIFFLVRSLEIFFRTNKSEGTTLFLADVLSACYGKDNIDKIVFPVVLCNEFYLKSSEPSNISNVIILKPPHGNVLCS